MDIIEALASVALYNGWNEMLCKIRDYMKREMELSHNNCYWSIAIPDFLVMMNPSLYPRIIWSVMVEMFGDFSCSPRTGWINGDRSNAAFQFIEKLCERSCE